MKLPKNCKVESIVSDDKARLVLSQPYLDRENGVVVSTNGKAMAIVPVECDETDVSGHIPVEMVKLSRKTAWGKLTVGEMSVGQESVRVKDVSVKRPELGTYPKWEQVIPKAEPEGKAKRIRFGINAEMLRSLSQALGSDEVSLEIEFDTEGRYKDEVCAAIRVQPLGAPESGRAYGVIMPMRL